MKINLQKTVQGYTGTKRFTLYVAICETRSQLERARAMIILFANISATLREHLTISLDTTHTGPIFSFSKKEATVGFAR